MINNKVQCSLKIVLKVKKGALHVSSSKAVWKAKGQSFSKILVRLNRHKSTISRQLKRNKNSKIKYYSCLVQDKSDLRKHKDHKKERISNPQIRSYVEEKLKLGWFPEIILGRIKIEHSLLSISHECIYEYIYEKKR